MRRRSKDQINSDKIIKKNLLALGETIKNQAVRTSRRDYGRLQDEQNYRVIKDTILVMAQMHYGHYNYPKGVNSGRKNALLIAIDDNINSTVKVITAEITDQILAPFKTKRK